MILLVVAVSALVGLALLFLVLGIARQVHNPAEHDDFMERLSNVTSSEIEDELEEDENNKSGFDWTQYWYKLYQNTGRRSPDVATPSRLALGVALLGGGVGFFIWPGDIMGGIALLAGAPFILRGFFLIEVKRRSKALEKQLPLLLSGMRANLQANLTPQQALIAVADDIPSPLGDELKILKADLGVNVPLEMSLRNLADRVPSREIKFLVASIEIAVSSGSDLDPQLQTIESIVDQRTRIRQKLASAVANAQPAIFVSAIIIPAGFLFSFYSSDTNKEYWTTFVGLLTGAGVALLYIAGLIISKKLVDRIENS